MKWTAGCSIYRECDISEKQIQKLQKLKWSSTKNMYSMIKYIQNIHHRWKNPKYNLINEQKSNKKISSIETGWTKYV